jgi:hypothetical protein
MRQFFQITDLSYFANFHNNFCLETISAISRLQYMYSCGAGTGAVARACMRNINTRSLLACMRRKIAKNLSATCGGLRTGTHAGGACRTSDIRASSRPPRATHIFTGRKIKLRRPSTVSWSRHIFLIFRLIFEAFPSYNFAEIGPHDLRKWSRKTRLPILHNL